MKDADSKIEVLTRLLEVARLIRRRGPADQAEAVLPYERLLEADLKARQAEVNGKAAHAIAA